MTSIDSRRLLGSYYTPDKLATILAEWALQPGEGTVLDPSFGGCAFLNAATKVLSDRGVPDPGRLVFGVDVDPSCLKYVRGNGNLTEKNCIFNDFLTLSPKEVPGTPFKAVIGNPLTCVTIGSMELQERRAERPSAMLGSTTRNR